MVRAALTPVVVACALVAVGCGDVDVTTETASPSQAVESAQSATARAAFEQLEYALLACHAEEETFLGCELQSSPEVTVRKVTATTFELTAGELVSSYDATRDTVPCHSTLSSGTGCVAW